jgi:DNA-binding helix-hairpin-helix protein with protein kinase domain
MTAKANRPGIFRVPCPGESIFTLDGLQFVVGDEMGRGGQGAVFALSSDEHRCVKVYFEDAESRSERLRERFEALRKASATESLVLPQAVLRAPATGYIMQRVRGASPMRLLAVPPRGRDVKEWYGNGGGLRRRLQLAAQLAHAFQDLHRRGLAYCDLSWENVLVPDVGPPSVRLIDCDNLTIDGVPPAKIVGTDWFMAPEIADRRGRPNTTSDQHALAVLIYHLLTLTHPLLGDAIRASEPDSERNAIAGRWLDGSRLPWVDHPDDRRNATRSGLTRTTVHSRLLRQTFHDVFGEGLMQPTRRATESRWLDVLGRAIDGTLTCDACRQTFYVTEKSCPFCTKERAQTWMLMCRHPTERRPVVVEQRRRLFARHLRTQAADIGEAPWAMATVEGDGLVVESAGAETIEVMRTTGSRETLPRGAKTRLKLGDVFHASGNNVLVEVTRG